MEVEQQPEEKKLKLNIRGLAFAFDFDFDEEPTVKDLCEAIIAISQNISIAALQKEVMGKAIAGAKEGNTHKFAVRGALTKEGIEVTVAAVKEKSIIEAAGPEAMNSLSRQQRRSMMRSLK